jgi:non-heme chloroperoxidase
MNLRTEISSVTSAAAAGHATRSGTRVGFATLRSGLRLAYGERGPVAETALVLVHGLSDSWLSFEPLMALLPESLRVVAVSLRGHGDSERPESGYRLPDLATDLRDLLDALEIESAVIAGHSLGASVAMRFGIDHPERALGLALLGAFAGYRQNPAVLGLQAVVEHLSDPVDQSFIRDFQRATLARPIAEETLEQVIRDSRKLPARVWKAIVAGLCGPEGTLPLQALRVPSLLLWGALDNLVPRADQEHLLARISNSRLIAYPGAGHAFHWEDPVPSARALADFAASRAAAFQLHLTDRGASGR